MIKLVLLQLLKTKLLKGFCPEGGTEVHCRVILALCVDHWIGAVNYFSWIKSYRSGGQCFVYCQQYISSSFN